MYRSPVGYSSSRRACIGGLLSALVLLATATASYPLAFTPTEQKCRATISRDGSTLAVTAARSLSKCHKDRLRGREQESTNCNSVTDGDRDGKIEKARSRFVEHAPSRCAGLSPSFLGYDACPSPCDDQVPSISTFGDVVDCLVCVIEGSAEAMSASAQGTPDVPLADDAERCHGEIGKRQSKHFQTLLKSRRKCQRLAERAGDTDTRSCEGSDAGGKIERARRQGRSKIADRCFGVDLAAVDSCDQQDVTSLGTCVFAGSTARGSDIFRLLHGFAPPQVTTTTTLGSGTTTTSTTTTSTTTTLPPQDAQCPDSLELTLFATIGGSCSNDADCVIGTCDDALGRCRTPTELDTGWSGLSHDSDIVDQAVTVNRLYCPGPFDGGSSEPCGQCEVLGIDPSTGACRCANDNRAVCDEPFASDADDCGGDLCQCFLGPPLALSAGNIPVCVVNRMRQDVGGTVNVDTGSSSVTSSLAAVIFGGINVLKPCPYCDGDLVAGDGVRDGTCVDGRNAGLPCDVDGANRTFPAPGGGGSSLDCFPDVGKNISGSGLKIDLEQTTGTADPIHADIECVFGFFTCHCMLCSEDPTLACATNTDCPVGKGTCTRSAPGEPTKPNGCQEDAICNDVGTDDGECNKGPTDKFCDGVLRANGEGFLQCSTNADCDGSSCGPVSCGACTITKKRECFLETIEATGVADPVTPVGVASFCIPPTSNSGVNATAGLPGPGRLKNQGGVRMFCASDPGTTYVPGAGGCP